MVETKADCSVVEMAGVRVEVMAALKAVQLGELKGSMLVAMWEKMWVVSTVAK